jgi:hypothetical protein
LAAADATAGFVPSPASRRVQASQPGEHRLVDNHAETVGPADRDAAVGAGAPDENASSRIRFQGAAPMPVLKATHSWEIKFLLMSIDKFRNEELAL